MQLARNAKAISKLALILLLCVTFILGALLSYVYTIGFYAPQEFQLPTKTNLTIENVQFFVEDATFFNVTVLNPSYSPSDARIERIKVLTGDGKAHSVFSTLPSLPLTLGRGKSQTIKSFWGWGNYTNQTVDIYVLIAEGSGPAVQVNTAFMNLTVTSVSFEPAVTVTRFNVTVESMRSPVSVDISEIVVNDASVADVTPSLPHLMTPNSSVTFTLRRDWTDLQNKTVSVALRTRQGHLAYKTVRSPQVRLNVFGITFYNTTATTFFFNVTIQNDATSAAKIDINLITVYVEGQNITIPNANVTPSLPQTLDPNSTIVLTCSWNWSAYQNKNVTVTAYTVQGFKAKSEETKIPTIP